MKKSPTVEKRRSNISRPQPTIPAEQDPFIICQDFLKIASKKWNHGDIEEALEFNEKAFNRAVSPFDFIEVARSFDEMLEPKRAQDCAQKALAFYLSPSQEIQKLFNAFEILELSQGIQSLNEFSKETVKKMINNREIIRHIQAVKRILGNDELLKLILHLFEQEKAKTEKKSFASLQILVFFLQSLDKMAELEEGLDLLSERATNFLEHYFVAKLAATTCDDGKILKFVHKALQFSESLEKGLTVYMEIGFSLEPKEQHLEIQQIFFDLCQNIREVYWVLENLTCRFGDDDTPKKLIDMALTRITDLSNLPQNYFHSQSMRPKITINDPFLVQTIRQLDIFEEELMKANSIEHMAEFFLDEIDNETNEFEIQALSSTPNSIYNLFLGLIKYLRRSEHRNELHRIMDPAIDYCLKNNIDPKGFYEIYSDENKKNNQTGQQNWDSHLKQIAQKIASNCSIGKNAEFWALKMFECGLFQEGRQFARQYIAKKQNSGEGLMNFAKNLKKDHFAQSKDEIVLILKTLKQNYCEEVQDFIKIGRLAQDLSFPEITKTILKAAHKRIENSDDCMKIFVFSCELGMEKDEKLKKIIERMINVSTKTIELERITLELKKRHFNAEAIIAAKKAFEIATDPDCILYFCPQKSQPFGKSAEIDEILEETIENNKESTFVKGIFFPNREAKAAFSGEKNEPLRLYLQDIVLQKPTDVYTDEFLAVGRFKTYISGNWGFTAAFRALKIAGLEFESRLAQKIGVSNFGFQRILLPCFVKHEDKTPQQYQEMVKEPSIFDKFPKINIFEKSEVPNVGEIQTNEKDKESSDDESEESAEVATDDDVDSSDDESLFAALRRGNILPGLDDDDDDEEEEEAIIHGRKRLFDEMNQDDSENNSSDDDKEEEDNDEPKKKKREIEQFGEMQTYFRRTSRFGNCISTLWFLKRRNELGVQTNLNKIKSNFVDLQIFQK